MIFLYPVVLNPKILLLDFVLMGLYFHLADILKKGKPPVYLA